MPKNMTRMGHSQQQPPQELLASTAPVETPGHAVPHSLAGRCCGEVELMRTYCPPSAFFPSTPYDDVMLGGDVNM